MVQGTKKKTVHMEGTWRLGSTSVMKHRFRNSVKDVQTLQTRLQKIIRFQNSRPRWDLEKLYAQRQSVQDTLEVKLSAIECVSGSAEVQWKNTKECVLDTISDLVGKENQGLHSK